MIYLQEGYLMVSESIGMVGRSFLNPWPVRELAKVR